MYKGAAYMADNVLADNYKKAPVSTAFNTDDEIWKWMERYPGFLQRIQMVMMGWTSLYPHKKNMNGVFGTVYLLALSDKLYRL